MRRTRFTEEKIIAVLKESAAGAATGELCRRHGISRQTFYAWKQKYGGMEVSEARRLRQVEEENRRLKKAVADLTLDGADPRGDTEARKKVLGPARRLRLVCSAIPAWGSERRVCAVLGAGRSSVRYRSERRRDDEPLRHRLRALSQERHGGGCRC